MWGLIKVREKVKMGESLGCGTFFRDWALFVVVLGKGCGGEK